MVAALSQATSPSAFPFSIPTMFAPMEGVTTPILRDEISKLGGVGVVCTEFIRISSEVIRPEHLRKQVVKSKHSALSVQLMGKGSDWMAGAAQVLDEAGADVVDINMGCPTRRAVRGGVGAAMLSTLHDAMAQARHLSSACSKSFVESSRPVRSNLAVIVDVPRITCLQNALTESLPKSVHQELRASSPCQ